MNFYILNGSKPLRLVLLLCSLLLIQASPAQQSPLDSIRSLVAEYNLLKETDGMAARESARRLLKVSQKAGSVQDQVYALYVMGSAHTFLGDLDSAVTFYQSAEKMAREKGSEKELAKALHAWGYYHSMAGNRDSAILYYQQALDIHQRLGLEEEEAMDKLRIGISFREKGNNEKAIEELIAAVAYFEQVKNTDQLSICYLNLGNIQYVLGKYDKCLAYFRQAYDEAAKSGNKRAMALPMGNSALVNYQLGNMEQAKSANLKTLGIFAEIGDANSEAIVWGNLANVYQKLGKRDSASYCFERAIALMKKMGSTDGLSVAYHDFGYALTEVGAFEESLTYFQQALEIAEKDEDARILNAIYENRGLTYEKMGKLTEALADFKKAMEYREQMFSSEILEKVTDADARYETEKTKADLAASELKVVEEQNKNLLIGGIAAFILLLVAAGFFLFLARRRAREREAQLALQLKETEAQNLRELDQLKSRFFANISHEFRTPLTLILAPIRRFLSGDFTGDPTTYYHTIHRNGERLLELVNQLLDLSRLESGKMVLKQEPGNLTRFLQGVTHSFHSMAESKHIQYEISLPRQEIQAAFDRDKLLKILSNLISNAMKFTQEEGKVSVQLSVGSVQLSVGSVQLKNSPLPTAHYKLPTANCLLLTISDTGIGIPEDQLPYIFDRFYRVESNAQSGTGIGLALTRELVELHGGEIRVESVEGFGTTFRVSLPMEMLAAVEKVEERLPAPQAQEAHPLLLVVEDNAELRELIRSVMADSYRLLEAENGQAGLRLAKEKVPDLIISDVMMPLMDGIEMLSKLKSQMETSHIPVIMLTAKAEHEDRLQGLASGAEAYIAKPFDPQELLIRSRALVEQRRKLQAHFATEVYLKPQDVAVNSADEKFLQRVMDVIEIYMGDEAFSIEDLGREVGMSRSQLHRKLKAMTGRSSSLFLRSMRLQRAMDLLRQGAGTAAEVAYTVGFSSPAYFTKCFREQFGITPGEVRNDE